MIYGVYAVKDDLVGFMPAFCDTNDNVAVRNFTQAVNNPRTDYYSNVKDYSLYKVGTYDTETGVMSPYFEFLVSAINLIKAGE